MKNLAHSASFHSMENIAPSKPGIKHLAKALARGPDNGSRILLPQFQPENRFPLFLELL